MRSLVSRFLMLCLFTCGLASAQVQDAEMSAEGRGSTRAQAILDALSNASAQASGFTLQSSIRQSLASAEVLVDEAQSSAVLEQFNKAIARQVSTDKARLVTGYQVNAADETANGRWIANVTVRYATYAKPGADSNRPTLVIASTSKQYPQAALEAVEQAVVASDRFDVLTRSHNAVFEQEKLFITGADASRIEVARLAGASGADYVLIIDLQDLEVQNNHREVIKMSDEVMVSSKLSGTLRLRIMEFTSRKIKWVGTQAFAETLKGRTQITSDVLAKNLSAAARKLVTGMVESIVPIRVVRSDGNMLVLNRGEGLIDQGEQLSVFVLGEDLRDPHSGESLGRMETQVATGTIVEVKPRYSVLRLTSSLSVGDNTELLVRPQARKETPPAPNPSRDAAVEGRERNRSLLTDTTGQSGQFNETSRLNPSALKALPERDAVAIIIGIQSYKYLPPARFANSDARLFSEYARRLLGVRSDKIRLLTDGDAGEIDIARAFRSWLMRNVNKGKTDVYIFYSGHGLPSDDGKSLYLLPHNADRDFIDKTAINQAELISLTEATGARTVTMFIDSCYSGQTRHGDAILANARPVALKSNSAGYPSTFTVFTASAPDQISWSSDELGHGLFSYYLMKGMEGAADGNQDGKLAAGELHAYLLDKVNRQAAILNRKQQPQLVGDPDQIVLSR